MPSVPTPTFLVGIDLDHTLISYARGLRRWAETLGITISPGDSLKDAVRQNCWNSAEGDVAWQRIQADLYGPGMNDAEVMPGARAFLHWLDRNRIPAVVVSHKTVFAAAAPDGPNLRETALAWMAAQGLFSPETGLTRERVYFAATRAEKAARIAALGCTHFIDDLPAVFLDPGFPLGVRSVLFAPDGANEDGAWSVVSSWDDAGRRIAHDLELPWHELPTEIHGTPVVNTARLHGGRNSSVYRLDCSDGARYAAKCYESTERMTREAEALRYLNARSIPSIPSLASMDSPAAVVYEFIPGTSPVTDVSEADIDVAMGFIRAINTPPRDGWERSAAEAVFSLSEVEDTIRARTQRLLETPADTPLHDDMRAFVRGTLLGLLAELAPCDPTPLPLGVRVLSPSDFGFHNAVRRPDGTLFFLDFEYFGWDDPAKLISDFCWHPAMNLSGAQKRQFASGIAEIVPDRDLLLARLPAAHALFGLKWCTILLNEFLPHHWLRRTFAGDERSREVALTEQLEKSRAVALRVAALHGVFPYLD